MTGHWPQHVRLLSGDNEGPISFAKNESQFLMESSVISLALRLLDAAGNESRTEGFMVPVCDSVELA